MKLRVEGVSWMSPEIEDTPVRISLRKPEDTDTAIIMTRYDTAMETIGSFPLNLRREAMNRDASIWHYFITASLVRQDSFSTSSVETAISWPRNFFSNLTFFDLRARRTQFLMAV